MGYSTQYNGSYFCHCMKNYKRNKGGADIRGEGAAGAATKKKS